jgi:hypothetical protein
MKNLWTRLRHWYYRRRYDLGGPIMVRYRGHWLYVDPYGNIYEIEPTYHPEDPLRISVKVRA